MQISSLNRTMQDRDSVTTSQSQEKDKMIKSLQEDYWKMQDKNDRLQEKVNKLQEKVKKLKEIPPIEKRVSFLVDLIHVEIMTCKYQI